MKRDVALWTGVLTGPVVWSIFFLAKFFISYAICAYGWKPAAYALSILPLVPTVAAGILAWGQWQQLRNEPPDGRARALAMAGVALSAGFSLVLIAQTIPELLLAGCE